MKSILVIGGNGFIGKAYLDFMTEARFQCTSYDLPQSILDTLQLQKEVEAHDMVVHFAAMANIVECFDKQDQTFDVNIRGTYNVGRACVMNDKPLIFISTCCVYGNSLDSVEMEYKTSPMASEPYACSKVAGEYILRGMMNLNYMILRIGTVYGPGMREALFTYICLDKVRKGEKIYIDGDGLQTRQLIHINDLIRGISSATVRFPRLPNGRIYNLCGTEKTSALQTMWAAEQVTVKKAIYEHRHQRYGQTMNENISILKAEAELEWIPKIKFMEGMFHTYHNDERFK